MSSTPKNNILILGPTGLLGLMVVKEALSRDLKITLYVRNPQKLSKEITDNKNVTVSLSALLLSRKLIISARFS